MHYFDAHKYAAYSSTTTLASRQESQVVELAIADQAEDQIVLSTADVDHACHTLASETFWSTCRIIAEIGFHAELVGRWCEGCCCHEDMLVSSSSSRSPKLRIDCPLKCCRAPELACGAAIEQFQKSLADTQHQICEHLKGIPTVEEQQSLKLDWEKARGRIQAELELKGAHWGMLPHLLCGLGHHQASTVIQVAIRCLKLWDRSGRGNYHQMSRRFLDPHWCGSSARPEKPLRPIVPHLCSELLLF